MAVVPNGELYLKAAEAMKEYLSVLRDAPPLLPTPTFQKLVDLCKTHLLAATEAGVSCLPKHHLTMHLMLQMSEMGNARTYSTFLHESVNGDMASIARSNHFLTWQRRCLLKYRASSSAPGAPLNQNEHIYM